MNMRKSSVSNFSKAKSDPAICLFPGLFTSQLKGSHGKRTTLEYRLGQARHKELLRVTMLERLGVIDMCVLQGLTALACEPTHRARIDPATTTERGLLVLDGLVPERTAADNEAIITAKFLPYELARVIGKDDSKKSVAVIFKSLTRLYKTTLFWIRLDANGREIGPSRQSFMISRFDIGKKLDSGQYEIGLNARISKAIAGGGKYTRIDMNEARALHSDPARLIHQRLSGFIDVGSRHPHSIKVATLAGYVWDNSNYQPNPDADPGPGPALYRQHKLRVRKAMMDIRAVGWSIEEQPDDKYKIGRPALQE